MSNDGSTMPLDERNPVKIDVAVEICFARSCMCDGWDITVVLDKIILCTAALAGEPVGRFSRWFEVGGRSMRCLMILANHWATGSFGKYSWEIPPG